MKGLVLLLLLALLCGPVLSRQGLFKKHAQKQKAALEAQGVNDLEDQVADPPEVTQFLDGLQSKFDKPAKKEPLTTLPKDDQAIIKMLLANDIKKSFFIQQSETLNSKNRVSWPPVLKAGLIRFDTRERPRVNAQAAVTAIDAFRVNHVGFLADIVALSDTARTFVSGVADGSIPVEGNVDPEPGNYCEFLVRWARLNSLVGWAAEKQLIHMISTGDTPPGFGFDAARKDHVFADGMVQEFRGLHGVDWFHK